MQWTKDELFVVHIWKNCDFDMAVFQHLKPLSNKSILCSFFLPSFLDPVTVSVEVKVKATEKDVRRNLIYFSNTTQVFLLFV